MSLLGAILVYCILGNLVHSCILTMRNIACKINVIRGVEKFHICSFILSGDLTKICQSFPLYANMYCSFKNGDICLSTGGELLSGEVRAHRSICEDWSMSGNGKTKGEH